MTKEQVIKKIEEHLFSLSDQEYQKFHAKLMPTIKKELIIGVRVPLVRKYANEINKTEIANIFINMLPHKYYEENNLHAFIIEKIKDYDEAIIEVERFLPYINNWATCDSFSPIVFKKNLDKLFIKINEWIKSDRVYTIRFGLGMLMNHYLDDLFDEKMFEDIFSITNDDYYVRMMIAWYFATALTKQYDKTIKYFETPHLNKWIHNKSIQKALESYRILPEQKVYLRSLKIK